MARVFNGAMHYTSEEIAQKIGGNAAQWRHYARTKKVPAVKWIDGNWYFNPDEINKQTVESNRNMCMGPLNGSNNN